MIHPTSENKYDQSHPTKTISGRKKTPHWGKNWVNKGGDKSEWNEIEKKRRKKSETERTPVWKYFGALRGAR